MLRQFIYSEPKKSGTEVPVVKGTCPVCGEEVTDKDKRYKHNGQYYHNKCYKTLKTPFVCDFCGGATTYSDIAVPEMKDVTKTMKGNEKIVGYYHFKCLIASAQQNHSSSSSESDDSDDE